MRLRGGGDQVPRCHEVRQPARPHGVYHAAMIHLVLAVTGPIVDEHSSAYKSGQLAGRIFVIILAVALLWRLVKWLKK